MVPYLQEPMHERNISLAAKGKAKENVHWHLGWWDLIHALEGTRRYVCAVYHTLYLNILGLHRPVQWSKSSVIFTTDEFQPLVLARHFPTSRKFALLSPPPVINSPASYDPPSVLSLSPTDDWLFAYFPGRGADGVGCLWRRGNQLDNWVVREYWSFAVGAGVVTAAWTSGHREVSLFTRKLSNYNLMLA